MYRDADKPNDLTLSLNYESRERTDELMRDPSLAEAMQRGDVRTSPHTRCAPGQMCVTFNWGSKQ